MYVCVSRLDENKPYIESFTPYAITLVYLEDLVQTPHHQRFHLHYTNLGMNSFWKYAMERFFYVEECMKTYGLTDVFHHEFDNMVYFKADELAPLCKQKNKLLIPSDSDSRFIAGSCYIPSAEALTPMNECFSEASGQNEMEMMMQFYRLNQDKLEGWPIVPPEYTHQLKPISGHAIANPHRMHESVSYFKGVFDAAAIGQYFGGIDPIHDPNNTDGYVSPDCAFQVDQLRFQWKKHNELYQPWISADQTHWYPIYNLHIHNKNMSRWLSNVPEMTAHLSTIQVV